MIAQTFLRPAIVPADEPVLAHETEEDELPVRSPNGEPAAVPNPAGSRRAGAPGE
jgi:hypothetical protein